MRPIQRIYTTHQNDDTIQRIKKELGAVRTCHCGVYGPEYGTVFEVTEPLQTCHSQTLGPMVDGCLPPGVYQVLENEIAGSGSRHWISLQEIRTRAIFNMSSGIDGGPEGITSTMDWSTIRKPASL